MFVLQQGAICAAMGIVQQVGTYCSNVCVATGCNMCCNRLCAATGCKQWPPLCNLLPPIAAMFVLQQVAICAAMGLELEGFRWATALDLNMGYYHVGLNPGAKKHCTTVLPFGKFGYQRLPIGLCNSPGIFQERMVELFGGLGYIRCYIDDLLCATKGNFEDHLDKLSEVLRRTKEAGLKVNAEKSFFARGEMEYLGYWVARDGIQPQAKKIQAIHRIAEPSNKKDLRRFIGLVNYYRDMWVRRSHILAPLAKLTSKTAKWQWTERESKAFHEMKAIMAKDVLLAYPDFSKKFVIHTDASHTQLGAVISQNGKPIAFYSWTKA